MSQGLLIQVSSGSCACANCACTGEDQVLDGAIDSWETFASWVQNTFAPTPIHFP